MGKKKEGKSKRDKRDAEWAEEAIDISPPDEDGPFGNGEEGDEEWMEEDPFFEDDGPPSPKDIREQDQFLLRRQQKFRAAAEAVARAFSEMPEVQKVMLFGSVAVPLKKEVPRFRKYRRAGIEVWHECKDVDLAVWLTDLACLRTLQKTRARALKAVQEKDGACVAHHQVEIFILDPKTDRYLGRLCNFGKCPKGKNECRVPGCGEPRFIQKHEGFVFKRAALKPDRSIILFDRSLGTTVEETQMRKPRKDEATLEAIEDWHYWVNTGYEF